ncbi:MAG: hypothetical protein V4727_05955 [Verrucomicrobiota bacterium]
MKSSQILLLSTIVLSVFVGWEGLLKVLVLVAGPAVLVQGSIYVVCKVGAFKPLRSAIASFFWKIPMALGFSLIVGISVGVIAAMVMLLRGFAAPSESWLYVSLGFMAGVMGAVEGIKKSKIRYQQSSIVNRSE